MGSVRFCVLILITMSGSKAELVKGYDLVYKPANNDAPRALLVNEKGNPVQSVATDAFTACLFTQLDSYQGLTDVYLFSFSSQRNDQVDEIVMRLDYLHNQTSLYIHGHSTSVNVVPSLDEWTHICVSWESKGGRVDLHVNGVRVGNGGPVEPGYFLGVEGYFILGQDQDSFNGDFYPDSGVHGKVTQFNLWNRVLTTSEVKEVQTCKLEGNVVSWSDSYWSLEGSLYKQKSVHPCVTSISQGCGCLTSATEKFQNLLQTYKAEIQDDCGQRVSSLDQNLKTEISQQKQAIDAFGQRLSSLDQNLRSEMSSLIAIINTTLLTSVQQLSAAINTSRIPKEKIICPPDFILIHDHCYYFSPEIMNNWDEASKLCQQLNPRAMLANFETETEWAFLKIYLIEKKLNDKHWWIGGSDQGHEGHWTWVGSNQPLAYGAWCTEQPDNALGNENCLHIWQGMNPLCWNDLHCTHDTFGFQLNFICEIQNTM